MVRVCGRGVGGSGLLGFGSLTQPRPSAAGVEIVCGLDAAYRTPTGGGRVVVNVAMTTVTVGRSVTTGVVLATVAGVS